MGDTLRNIKTIGEYRQAVDEVDTDVVEASGTGVGNGDKGLRGGVTTVEEPQHAVVEALDAYAYAIEESQPGKRLQVVGREVLWVGLDGDFLHLRHVEAMVHALHDARKLADG